MTFGEAPWGIAQGSWALVSGGPRQTFPRLRGVDFPFFSLSGGQPGDGTAEGEAGSPGCPDPRSVERTMNVFKCHLGEEEGMQHTRESEGRSTNADRVAPGEACHAVMSQP